MGAEAVPSSDHEKINFYGRIAIFMKLGAHGPNRRRSRPPAQIMRKSIFTVESQFSWNWVPTAQIGAEAVPELRSWENQFLRPNRNFHEIGCPRPKSAQNPSPSSDHEKINFYGRIAIFMKLGAHGPNRRRSRPRAQIMRKSIFTVESQFSWNWVPTAQIGAEAVPQLRSWENQFLRSNRNFHEIGWPTAQIGAEAVPSSDHEKINFYGRIAIFMKLRCPRPKSAQKASPSSDHEKINFYGRIAISHEIGSATAQIGAEAVAELRSWENQFLRPNRNFHEIGCPRPKSAQKASPSSDHEKINFYGRIAIFMKLGAHGPNRRRSRPRAQIMRKSIFTAESQFSWNWVPTAQIGAKPVPELRSWENQFLLESQFSWNWVPTAQIGAEAVPQLRSWENQFLRPNRNFHEIGCPRPKSAQNPSVSSDHEKINFYGRIAIFMKLGAHGPNRRRSRPQLRSWENQFLRPNRNFHEIGCPRPKSAQKPSPSSDHEKINFYGRIAIFMKLGAHGPNRRRRPSPAQIMRKSIFTAESQFSWNWVATGPNRRRSRGPPAQIMRKSIFTAESQFSWNWVPTAQIGADLGRPRAQIMRKSIFTAESQFSWNWVPTAQIGAEAVPQLRSWENQFLRPNRNFHEIGCPRPKSAQKPSPSSDHEKINFTAESQFSWNWAGHGPNRRRSRPQLRSWENQFLRPNRNFHEIGCPRPKSAQKPSPSSDHEKINFYGRIAIFMKLGAHGPNRRRTRPRAQIMRKSIFTAESQFSWNWVPTAQIGADLGRPPAQIMRKSIFTVESQFSWNWVPTAQIGAEAVPSSDHEKINFSAESHFSWNWVATAQIGADLGRPQLRSWENQFLRPNRNFHEIGCPRPKSAQIWAVPELRFHEKLRFLRPNCIFSWNLSSAHGPNLRRFGPWAAQISWEIAIFTAVKIAFSHEIWARPTAQICADLGRPQPRFHEKLRFLRP